MKHTPDRREFLVSTGAWLGAGCLGCAWGTPAWAQTSQPAPTTSKPSQASKTAGPGQAGKAPGAQQAGRWTREIDYYDQLSEKRIQCHVCPLNCILQDGETCFCRTRTNVGGKLLTRAYDNPCILQVDPIEKLPLNHFRPGSQTLTIGVGGCNLRCIYCQNWEQSQKMPDELKTFPLTPAEAVAQARKKKLDTIAFSYTEPVAFLEYAKDVAIAAKKAKLRVVVATAAFAEPGPLIEFAQHVDAFVVTLKGFDEDFYHRACGIRLAPVLTAIEALKKNTKCWLELLNLVVPTYNDDPAKIAEMVKWVHEHLGDQVPLHFARFVPMYKLGNLPRTPVQTLEAACDAGRQAGLRHVYTSNIAPHEGNNTVCPKCGTRVIQRLGFKILENKLAGGACPQCKQKLPGAWV
jgi:pyruvate formate lyase activating enzyme